MPTDDYIKKADALFAVQKRIEQIGMGNVLIAEKRAEIERLKAEIAKMPPLDYDKLAENPLEPPKEKKDVLE